mmetsp:Transcript_13824/g.27550  ORF Transcript_13824/g.27550 Transcript_13824/m.27550 type:complete len:204 (-) Transcript_13824:575-1186(-)
MRLHPHSRTILTLADHQQCPHRIRNPTDCQYQLLHHLSSLPPPFPNPQPIDSKHTPYHRSPHQQQSYAHRIDQAVEEHYYHTFSFYPVHPPAVQAWLCMPPPGPHTWPAPPLRQFYSNPETIFYQSHPNMQSLNPHSAGNRLPTHILDVGSLGHILHSNSRSSQYYPLTLTQSMNYHYAQQLNISAHHVLQKSEHNPHPTSTP